MWLTSLVIREMLIETIMGYHFKPNRLAKINKTELSICKNRAESELSHTASEGIK